MPTKGILAAAGAVPQLGDHGLTGHIQGSGTQVVSTTIDTQVGGSTLLVGHAGLLSGFGTVSDNKGSSFSQRGSTISYTNWGSYGFKLFADDLIAGGASHTVQVSKSNTFSEEATLTAVEIKNGGVVGTPSMLESALGATAQSGEVTTTGPAVLVAWHLGDEGSDGARSATPPAGWTSIESYQLTSTPHIQMAVAVKEVSAAGTYSILWAHTPNQRAILVLVAVQKN